MVGRERERSGERERENKKNKNNSFFNKNISRKNNKIN